MEEQQARIAKGAMLTSAEEQEERLEAFVQDFCLFALLYVPFCAFKETFISLLRQKLYF